MPYAILAYDATDADALNRRMAARDAHLKHMEDYTASGHMIYGGAILDDNEKMVGSLIVTAFETREKVEQWLSQEPYVMQKVWSNITVLHCKTGPSFEKRKRMA